jgi:hypothetical protein
MPTIETKIWLALKARIDTLNLSYAKAWPAQKYAPSAGAPYLRIGKIAVDPRRLVLSNGKPHERTGTLMVTLVHPLTQDFSVYQELQGQIASHFADGTQMTYKGICVSVPSYPHCVDGYEGNGWWTAPVSIRWRCVA